MSKGLVMKVGDIINFFLFGEEVQGEVLNINIKEKTVRLLHEGYNYPEVQTFRKLPKKKSDVPPWYILTNQNKKR
jgi:hypothetical protein